MDVTPSKLTADQLFELEKMRIETELQIRKNELELQAQERKHEKGMQLEAAQREGEFELHTIQVEHQNALELAKANSAASSPVHPAAVSSEITAGSKNYRIDILKEMVQ